MAKIPPLNGQIDRGSEKPATLKLKVGKQKLMEIASRIKKKKRERNIVLFIDKKYDKLNYFDVYIFFLFFFFKKICNKQNNFLHSLNFFFFSSTT